MISDHMINTTNTNKKIGGPGLTVEIDESQFGKRKYNRGTIRGRRFAWVLGGVCRETKEIFVVQCPDNKRDKPTLEKIIIDNVEKGTKIYTDGWPAYKGLKYLGYDWDSVNHSKEFIKEGNPDVHTQRIEGTWFRIKRWLPSSGRYKLGTYLPVFLWNIDCDRRGVAPFWELLDILCQPDAPSFLDIRTEEVEESNKVPCVYCGVEFKEKGLRRHYTFCKDSPGTS